MNKHERAIRSVAAVTFRGEDREPIWQLLPAGHSLEVNLPTALYPQEQVKALEAERDRLLEAVEGVEEWMGQMISEMPEDTYDRLREEWYRDKPMPFDPWLNKKRRDALQAILDAKADPDA